MYISLDKHNQFDAHSVSTHQTTFKLKYFFKLNKIFKSVNFLKEVYLPPTPSRSLHFHILSQHMTPTSKRSFTYGQGHGNYLQPDMVLSDVYKISSITLELSSPQSNTLRIQHNQHNKKKIVSENILSKQVSQSYTDIKGMPDMIDPG